ncbi:2,3,4,5-tetrahydropyridine-2,6-dicarboxylate N-acetyltransferase [Mesotoga sp. BH458_6_3_2_1]|uniref:2,3,4,5-tetrahydropyridine-2,6-dicarboxylate N-acetyltransferase n=1 Tax=Mesotoga sp. BH458_6_3_2_1 TaxID=1437446 RepID=UPI000EF1BB01|nr:2,3,4,5-tetrahydropyridine-2,6-dicarboxylate N-acetyltransferase [Mesotoga sp. BH458_6_3_2_1]RLL85547.1 2,3,4,5-tetrahydropyridine-2,6-carboxylate N-succinyltransferase [Mesotoga sp. BH458_6_3_2_1]
MDAEMIIKMIRDSKKKTPAKCYISGELDDLSTEGVEFVGGKDFGILFGDLKDINGVIEANRDKIIGYRIEIRARNSALPLADLTKYRARIEPGAIIRDLVEIGDNAVIMMGAVLNVGAVIGKGTMIDMNVVVGGRAIIGADCHIGAGAVVAGVVEPPSATPVIIEDNVLVGANAVILEGVRIGTNSVIGAGAVVTKDVPPFSVAAGMPAKVIKQFDEKTASKTNLVKELREIREN